jgi:hypothetical protein
MRLRFGALLISAFIIILFVVLPLISPRYIPDEAYTYLKSTSGIDLKGILNTTAIVGFTMAVFILLRSHIEKTSLSGFIVNIVWNTFLFLMVTYLLSFGDMSKIGVVVLGSEMNNSANLIILDLRFGVAMAALIIILRIAQSTIEYGEGRRIRKHIDQPPTPLTSP